MSATGIHTAEDLRQRCWVDPQTGCWIWRFARDSRNDAPILRIPAIGRCGSLGAFTSLLRTGKLPRPGRPWHPTCATPHCANPDHRKEGTRKSQMLRAAHRHTADSRLKMSIKSRGRGRLSEQERAEILGSSMSIKEIATRYGVSEPYASELRSGRARTRRALPAASVFSWVPSA
jgi:hypothetical protein